MALKLVRDQGHPNKTDIDNLCLVTTSYFRRLDFIDDHGVVGALKAAKFNGTRNIDQVFAEADRGMISSAAWTQSGVDRYFVKRQQGSTVDGSHLLSVLRSIALTGTRAKGKAAMAAYALLSSENYRDLEVLWGATLAGTPYSKEDRRIVIDWLDRTANEWPSETVTHKCKMAFKDWVTRLKPANVFDFHRALKTFKIESDAAVGSCPKEQEHLFKALLPETNNIRSVQNLFWNSSRLLTEKSYINVDEIADSTKYLELLSTFFTKQRILHSSVPAGCPTADETPWNDKTLAFVDSLLGGTFFPTEKIVATRGPQGVEVTGVPNDVFGRFDSTDILHSFILGSEQVTFEPNGLDDRRRKACRSFILD